MGSLLSLVLVIKDHWKLNKVKHSLKLLDKACRKLGQSEKRTCVIFVPCRCPCHERYSGREQRFCRLCRSWVYQATTLLAALLALQDEARKAALECAIFISFCSVRFVEKLKYIFLQLPLVLLLNRACSHPSFANSCLEAPAGRNLREGAGQVPEWAFMRV